MHKSIPVLIVIAVAGIGAFIGWLYATTIGCQNGTCAITSSPVNNSLYGAFMGGVLGNILTDYLPTKK
ncbi:MAG: DUF6132 family protein [Bacteroidia bacterium]|jgi:hypothetical protein|nr:DUF6132 family protein [Bacteroidia bacterium]